MMRQKYTILQLTLPINMMMCDKYEGISMIDKIVTVGCALCNHYESVVSFN